VTDRDTLYLAHIVAAIERIGTCVSLGKAFFDADFKTQDSIIRQIEIIGEASKALSENAQQRMAGIEWRKITGMRDRLIHGYFNVDLDQVWNTATRDIPFLEKTIRQHLREQI
jgi:uncharacterized protein with HEPN domain